VTAAATETPACRVCGCTNDDCSKCIARTGQPCSWAEPDLCSACVPFVAGHETVIMAARELVERVGMRGAFVTLYDRDGHLHVAAVVDERTDTSKFVALARELETVIDRTKTDVVLDSATPYPRAACIHCRQEVATLDDTAAIRHHAMTCAASPVVQENIELKRQLEEVLRVH
jgi:hypothetical protein